MIWTKANVIHFSFFAFQRPLHERHNGREWVWSWDCQTMGSSEAPRHAGKEHADLMNKDHQKIIILET